MKPTEVGILLTGSIGRDAIHIAIAPVVSADAMLMPGQRIKLLAGTADQVVASSAKESLGIVDPFLTAPVTQGQRFYVWMHPNTITSLRHEWTHPVFDDLPAAAVSKKDSSEAWLRQFCASADCPDYETVIAAALDVDDYDEYIHFSGQDAHGEIPPEFWDHIEIVTGKTIPQQRRVSGFSCSC